MKGIALAGIALILFGVIGFAVGHIGITTKETVLDIGPLEVNKEEKHGFAIPDVAAGLALAAGLVLVVAGSRKA